MEVEDVGMELESIALELQMIITIWRGNEVHFEACIYESFLFS